jgi:hypothetical protein
MVMSATFLAFTSLPVVKAAAAPSTWEGTPVRNTYLPVAVISGCTA